RDGSKETKVEIPLMDQMIALGVERDVLDKQLEALKAHLETVQKENLELQLGMKEILDGLRQGECLGNSNVFSMEKVWPALVTIDCFPSPRRHLNRPCNRMSFSGTSLCPTGKPS